MKSARWMAALLVVASVWMSAGCGPASSTTAKPVAITLWHGWSGTELTTLTDLIDKYQKANPGWTVNQVQVPFDKLKDKVKTAVAAGSGAPDLVVGANDWTGELAKAGTISPVDTLIDSATWSSLKPTTVQAMTYTGQKYGLPESYEAVVLMYNKQFVTTPPASLDDIKTQSAAIASAHPGVTGLDLNAGFYQTAGLFFSLGGQIFDPSGNVNVNVPGSVSYLQTLSDLKGAPGVLAKDDYGTADSAFKAGKAAMILNGPWAIGDYKTALGANFGIVNGPTVNGKPWAPFLGVKGFFFPKSSDSDHQKAAAKFAEWMVNQTNATELMNQAGHLPANTSVDLTSNPMNQPFSDAANNAVPLPNDPKMNQVWTPMGTAIDSVLAGTAQPAGAITKAQADITTALQKNP